MEGRFQYGFPVSGAGATFSQRLSDMVARLWEGPIILVGHCKGGNLAIYVAMNADPKCAVHSACLFTGWPRVPAGDRDQPRLPHHPAEGDEIVPVRRLWTIFETPEPCRVVSSDLDGIMQHSAFTWLSDGDQFIPTSWIEFQLAVV